MMNNPSETVRVLEIEVSDVRAGFLAGYNDGENIFTFAHEYINLEKEIRPTLSLKFYDQPMNVFRKPLISRVKLPPLFSNLLPEGELRDYYVRNLKIDSDHDFAMLSFLGRDLPGAIKARELTKNDIPPYAMTYRRCIPPKLLTARNNRDNNFSLSGILMKFSMFEKNGQFFITKSQNIVSWIIKIPSTRFQHVPLNEYTCMQLAKSAGIDIPEIRLIKRTNIKGIPDIKMPDEKFAYAIKRFDRDQKKRIHSEDFAQIYDFYPAQKYRGTNYETMARTIYNVFPDAIKDIQEFAARLVVNIMIGNGDAHLKNWSIIYPDAIHPHLSPAYDIVFTRAYMENDDSIALNLGKEKKTIALSLDHFKILAERADFDWNIIKKRVIETIQRARDKWPKILEDLPMHNSHKQKLKQYWKTLTPDFKIII